jgi:hypothetical protein
LKKIAAFLFILSVTGCGSGFTRADFPKLIIGEWKAVKFGSHYSAMHILLPAAFHFRNDNTYTQTFNENGTAKTMQGKYTLKDNGFIYQIDLIQNSPSDALILGIITFHSENEMTLKLVNGFVRVRPAGNRNGDEQVYRRVN